jgi:hypothetical protein
MPLANPSTTSRHRACSTRLGRLVAVGAVALLAAASLAVPAAAMRRQAAVRLTNTWMGICFDLGGDPASEEADGVYEAEEGGGFGGGFSVSCQMPDGSAVWSWIPYSGDESQADKRSLAVGDDAPAAAATADGASRASNHGRHHAKQHREHTHHPAKHRARHGK